LGLPFKAIKTAAEIMHPASYTSKQMDKIKLGHDLTKDKMEQAYDPVSQKYGDFQVTVSPEKYLGFDQDEIKEFPTDVKRSYKNFTNEPTFDNLHTLQSKMGRKASMLSSNPLKSDIADNLRIGRQDVNNKISLFLSRDPEMLTQYNKGREIARDEYYPYLSNNVLTKISKGVKKDISPNQLNNALVKGREKIVYEKEGKPITAIPENHQLTSISKELKNRINIGHAAEYAIPTVASSLLGGHFYPGVGHIGGASAGALFSHYLQPDMIKFIQNPVVQKATKHGLGDTSQAIARSIAAYNMQNN